MGPTPCKAAGAAVAAVSGEQGSLLQALCAFHQHNAWTDRGRETLCTPEKEINSCFATRFKAEKKTPEKPSGDERGCATLLTDGPRSPYG